MRRTLALVLSLFVITCRKEPVAAHRPSIPTASASDVAYVEQEKTMRAREALALAAEVVARNEKAATPLDEDWAQFRRTFPFHAQVIALSAPVMDGTRTLIVAEPPPHATAADILVPLAPVLRSHRLKRQVLGFDGSVTDLVAAVAGTDSEVANAVSALHRRLFFTCYKAYVLQLPVHRTNERFDLDLDVTASEIRKWIVSDRESFSPVDGGPSIPASALFHLRASAVHRNGRHGLVTWWIPSGTLIDTCGTQVRQFAIDSDLVIGAIGNRAGTLVVGRERFVPVDYLPPLRFETIALLASAQSGSKHELRQSCARLARFAGPLDERRDWAPIHLSAELRDTEYGSLLSIADPPLRNPFGSSLRRQLKTAGLTCNWSTRGAAYAVDFGDSKVVALNRSGALPVRCIPDGAEDGKPAFPTLRAEDETYQRFSRLSDPNLVRVEQYAALFQIFFAFNVRNNHHDAAAGEYASRRLDEMTEELSKRIENADENQVHTFARQIAPKLAGVFGMKKEKAEAISLAYLRAYRGQPRSPENVMARAILSILAGLTGLPQRYAGDVAEHAARGWVHTPSVVMWRNGDPTAILAEGHDLGAEVIDLRVSETAARGAPTIAPGGHIIVHPDDVPRIPGLIRAAARLERVSPEVRQKDLARMLRRTKGQPPRAIPVALGLVESPIDTAAVPMPDPPGAGTSRRVGWMSSNLPVAMKAGQASGARIIVEHRDSGYWIEGDGLVGREAYDKSSAIDAIVDYVRRDRSNEPLFLDLRDFQPQEGPGLVRECEVLLAETGRPRSVSALKRDERVTDGVVVQFRRTEFDIEKATVEKSIVGDQGRVLIEIPRRGTGPGMKTDVRVRFKENTPGTLMVRVTAMIADAVRTVVARMQTMERKYDGLVFNQLLSVEIKRIRREMGIDLEELEHEFKEGAIDFRIVRNDGQDRNGAGARRAA